MPGCNCEVCERQRRRARERQRARDEKEREKAEKRAALLQAQHSGGGGVDGSQGDGAAGGGAGSQPGGQATAAIDSVHANHHTHQQHSTGGNGSQQLAPNSGTTNGAANGNVNSVTGIPDPSLPPETQVMIWAQNGDAGGYLVAGAVLLQLSSMHVLPVTGPSAWYVWVTMVLVSASGVAIVSIRPCPNATVSSRTLPTATAASLRAYFAGVKLREGDARVRDLIDWQVISRH